MAILCDSPVFAGLLGDAMRTMGMLDLGGGSTQITFMSSDKVCYLLMIVLCVLSSFHASHGRESLSF